MLPGLLEIYKSHIDVNEEGMEVSRSTGRKALEKYEVLMAHVLAGHQNYSTRTAP